MQRLYPIAGVFERDLKKDIMKTFCIAQESEYPYFEKFINVNYKFEAGYYSLYRYNISK